MRALCLSILVLSSRLATTATASGQEFRTNINPALLYYRSFLVAPDPMAPADRDYLGSKRAKEQKLPERFGPILAGYDNQFRLLHEAARAEAPCDWGIDLAEGPNSMLPHLGRAKAAAQAAQWRAVWALQHGRQAEARDELQTAFLLGRHAGSDNIFIGALVQCVIEGLDYGTVAQYFSEFTNETLQELLEGIDAAPARHPMAACVASEKRLGDWILDKLLELRKAYPDDDAKVMSGFRDSGVVLAIETIGYTNFWPRVLAASGGNSDGILRLLRAVEPLFPRLSELMALPEPEYEVRAKQLSAEIRQAQNPFLSTFATLFEGWILGQQRVDLRAREFRAQAQLAMVRAAVAYRLHGESGLQTVNDPFGTGPFTFQRFVFKGVDRGFELKSAYAGSEAPIAMIFVEKPGPAFQVVGPEAGQALTQ